MSSLSYIIQVYGGCSSYLINQLQVQQNKAARTITKLQWITTKRTLLLQCSWLSVRQLIIYHSLILLHKILSERKPENVFNKIERVTRETRTSDRQTLVDKRCLKTATAQRSFIPRVIGDWNGLPFELSDIQSHKLFKQNLRQYIRENIPVK